MIVAIAIVSVLAYLTGWEYTARWWFRKIRPYSEPLGCQGDYSWHEHSKYCYTREDSVITTNSEAAGWAALTGLAWPLVIIGTLVTGHIIRSDRPLREEMQAKIARLERELNEK